MKDIASAKYICRCCNGQDGNGIVDSFSAAQLLRGGHAICLHALRYEFLIAPKKKQNFSPDRIASLCFSVDSPSWADAIRSEDIPWILYEKI